jgi:hypothetical protein
MCVHEGCCVWLCKPYTACSSPTAALSTDLIRWLIIPTGSLVPSAATLGSLPACKYLLHGHSPAAPPRTRSDAFEQGSRDIDLYTQRAYASTGDDDPRLYPKLFN